MSIRPVPITIDGHEVYDKPEVDAYIEVLELQIGRLRSKLDEAYDRGRREPVNEPPET